jgi:NTP-dependent ternary system trypsin peptidase co-occuring protein
MGWFPWVGSSLWGGPGVAVRVVEVVLPNQSVALVQAADLDEGGQVAEKVGWKDTFDFAGVSGTLEGVAQAVRSGLEKVTPSKTTVELGIQLAIKNGMLTGLIVEGKADASLRVTLEWGKDPAADGPAA